MGQVPLLGSAVITALCSKLLLNFPSETDLDPVQVCCLLPLRFRNRTRLLVRRTAVPGRKDGCGDACRTEVHFTGLLLTRGATLSNAQL